LSFSTNTPSFKHNATKDLITGKTGNLWSSEFLGTKWPHTNKDNYNEAIGAPAEWWRNVPAEEILIVAGKDEVMVDGIKSFVETFTKMKPETTIFIAEGEAHDMPNLDIQFGYNEPGKQAKLIRSWTAARV